ncbi:MAG: NADH:flavin oxidoreductase [Promethearchaeota archaeon]
MSTLFKPKNIGQMVVKNRFVRSATYECMAKESGEVSEKLIKMYSTLAKGEIGLIIPGYLYVHPLGRTSVNQTGIHNDHMIPGLKKIVDVIHQDESKVVFQLAHAGMQTTARTIGTIPLAPSSHVKDPYSLREPAKMSEEQILEVIEAFNKAARRVIETGADGIQIHSAHTYLINQFLSPFFNQRDDDWGGSDENRFRILKELIIQTKKIIPKGMSILVKLNTNDYTEPNGILPELALKYAKWLTELKIDGLEISCGSPYFSLFQMCRGEVPIDELVRNLPDSIKNRLEPALRLEIGKHNLEEGYNLEAARFIKPYLGEIPLILVGGLRSIEKMKNVIESNDADFISMSRPFIRDPLLVKKIREKKITRVNCISCNQCLAAIMNGYPVACYVNKRK